MATNCEGSEHAPGHDHGYSKSKMSVLVGVLLLNASFLVVEAVGGWLAGSLALLADAVHMLTDVSGLLIAIVGLRLMARATTKRHSFGFFRSEVLAGLGNGVLLLAGLIWIVFEAIRRSVVGIEQDVDVGVVVGVGLVGLVINLASVAWLHGGRDENLNMRGAYLHMAADALSSVAVVGAALLIWVTGWLWLDLLVSLAIVALVFVPSVRLIRDALVVLMEATPPSVDVEDITGAVNVLNGVEDFHHVHVWQLSAGNHALSGHVTVAAEGASLHEAQLVGDGVSEMLASRFSIQHATLALECHPCGSEIHAS